MCLRARGAVRVLVVTWCRFEWAWCACNGRGCGCVGDGRGPAMVGSWIVLVLGGLVVLFLSFVFLSWLDDVFCFLGLFLRDVRGGARP